MLPERHLASTTLGREIAEQPHAVARFLERETAHVAEVVGALPPFDYAFVAARGTSDNAAVYAKYTWGAVAGLPVAFAAPSLHTAYRRPPRLVGALAVGISQSGQSPDIVAVLDEARQQNRPTLAVTNHGDSPLADAADHVVELHAGSERSLAATKTYTTELAAVALLAATMSGRPERVAELHRVPEALSATIDGTRSPASLAAVRLHDATRCIVIGRGYNLATAHELALKLKELAYMPAEAYSSADFRHGPIAATDGSSVAILVMPNDESLPDMAELADDLTQRDARLLRIAEDRSGFHAANTLPFSAKGPLADWLKPVSAIVPGQFFAAYLSMAKGLDPETPRSLEKVTRTL